METTYRVQLIDGTEYFGYAPYIKMAIWRPKRKPEPTLCIYESKDYFASVPVSQVKSMLPSSKS